MGCLKLHTEPLPNLRVIHSKKVQKPSKKMGSYYPFGLKHQGYNNVIAGRDHTFEYNGKELDEDLNWNMYHYGARFYDPATAKWYTIDAMAEKYLDQSPYNYAVNNPVIFIDPDGNQVEMCCKGLMNFLSSVHSGTIKGQVGFVANTIQSVKSGFQSSNMKIASIANGDFNITAKLTGNEIKGSIESTIQTVANYPIAAAEVLNGNVESAAARVTESNIAIGITILTEGAGRAALPKGSARAAAVVDETPVSIAVVDETPTWNGPTDYSHLVDHPSVGPSKKFTAAQKRNILEANRAHNDGLLRSDMDGTILDQPQQSRRGVPANMNQAEVDHIHARANGGSNSYVNSQVLSKRQNLDKRDN